MTVSLGGVALSEYLRLEKKGAGVGMSQIRLIGGVQIVQSDASIGGRTFTLSGTNLWTYAQVQALQAIQSMGLAVTLIHHLETFSVFISDTSNLEPSVAYAEPAADDWYSGTITLIEVDQ